MATERICIVDTDGTQPDAHYSSLAAAIAGETSVSPAVVTSADLVTNDEQLTIHCQATTGVVDTAGAVDVDVFTTDATRFLRILGDNDIGVWDESTYYTLRSPLTYGSCLQTGPYTVVEKMQVSHTNATGLNNVIQTSGATGTLIIDCILQSSSTAQCCYGSGSGTKIINTLFLGGLRGLFVNYNPHTVYHCTFIGCATGYSGNIGNHPARAFNNLFSGCTVDVDRNATGYFIQGNNATDLSVEETGLYTTGSDNRFGQAFAFTDSSNGDYSLLVTDTGARDQGYDLRSDATYPVTHDIAGNPRDATPDIGAFEYVISGPAAEILDAIISGAFFFGTGVTSPASIAADNQADFTNGSSSPADAAVAAAVTLVTQVVSELAGALADSAIMQESSASPASPEVTVSIDTAGLVVSSASVMLDGAVTAPCMISAAMSAVTSPQAELILTVSSPLTAAIELSVDMVIAGDAPEIIDVAIQAICGMTCVVSSPASMAVSSGAELRAELRAALEAVIEANAEAGYAAGSPGEGLASPTIEAGSVVMSPLDAAVDPVAELLWKALYLVTEILALASRITRLIDVSGETQQMELMDSRITTKIELESKL